MNLRAPIGVSLREVCAFCGVEKEPAKIILGGPMMGQAQPGLDAVISKCSNAVLLFDERQARAKPETACIRCGCCVMACPMGLQPFKLEQAYGGQDTRALEALSIQGCMECGSCAYVCPAGRDLVGKIRQGKELVRGVA
jgi:electron transport complex protein RnfC